MSAFEKLAECQPKLTKLIVTAVRPTVVARSDVLLGCFLKMQTFLSAILESSKDTLKYLEFRICPFGDIKFPILKSLECLKLVQSSKQRGGRFTTSPRHNKKTLVFDFIDKDQFTSRREDLKSENSNEVDARIYGLCPNRPCDSFPNLKKVQLDIQNYGVERNGCLLLFHTCGSHNRTIVPHVYKTVKVLEIYSKLPKIIEMEESVSLFLNVIVLKLKCESVKELDCSLWMLSPLAKSIEIYGISNNFPVCEEQQRGLRGSDDDEYEMIHGDTFVDSFFTGFSIDMCKKLKGMKQIPMEIEGNPLLMNVMRVKPSICDLQHLTDFKILFSKLRAPFASHVTGFYAFRPMPRTNVTFAHVAPIQFNEAECEIEKYLAPISSFGLFHPQECTQTL